MFDVFQKSVVIFVGVHALLELTRRHSLFNMHLCISLGVFIYYIDTVCFINRCAKDLLFLSLLASPLFSQAKECHAIS